MAKTYNSAKQLFDAGIITIAKLPEKNDYDLSRLEKLDGYTIPLTKKDYGAKTPLMWNTVYERLGLNLRNIMVVAKEQDLETITKAFRQDPKYLGGGVAGGFKEVIKKYLDRTIPNDLQAVNIIVKEQGKLVGYNTDAQGFVESLEEKLKKNNSELKGKHVVLFGAGGVGKEVARLLGEKKVRRLTIINRTYSKAVTLANELNAKHGQMAFGVPEDLIRGVTLNMIKGGKPDVFINTTVKGMDGPHEDEAAFAPSGQMNPSISLDVLRQLRKHNPRAIIADVVLNKKGKTTTLHLAELAGFPQNQLLDGVPMVVRQAVPAYKKIEAAHPSQHKNTLPPEQLLQAMQEAAKK